jgi:hypothetical protein
MAQLEVLHDDALAAVARGHREHQAQIGLDHLAQGLGVAIRDAPAQLQTLAWLYKSQWSGTDQRR